MPPLQITSLEVTSVMGYDMNGLRVNYNLNAEYSIEFLLTPSYDGARIPTR